MNLEELVVDICDNGTLAFSDMSPSSHDRGRTFFLHTSEPKVQRLLIELGWTPPACKAKVRLTEDELVQAIQLVRIHHSLEEAQDAANGYVGPIGYTIGGCPFKLSPAEIIASIDRQKKEAQDALAKLGIEYP